ncbi:MAG: glycosyltransferase family 2 protein, partial [Pseudomonadota bacterium]
MASSSDILIDPMASGLAPNTSRHGRITAVSMMKDEGPYAIEWVAHHMAVGFTDFVIYTNDCTDGTDAMLRRMQDMGLVQHRENRIAKGAKPQPSAIRHAQEDPAVRDSDWVMVFDA